MSINQSGLSSTSQVLLRSSHLLIGKEPLLVNMPEDGFINEYLSLNPQSHISCYNTNFIDYSAISARHKDTVSSQFDSQYQTEKLHDLAIITFPKSKAELPFTLAMIANYLTPDATILLVGEKKGGIQSSKKLIPEYIDNYQKIDSARHCMLFAGSIAEQARTRPFNLDMWYKQYQLSIDGINLTVASLPGVFSQQQLDIGTALLLNNLPKQMSGKVLDFGCGAGVISCFIGKKHPDCQLSMLDVNALALTSAKKTLEINGLTGRVFASNSLSTVNEKYQHIVSNPPFHQGIKTHYHATEQFLSGIKANMLAKSNITIVANSFLRYQPIMEQSIGVTKQLECKQGFTIYHTQC
ncbi:methyltransferase [Litorilituus lipolyticus]|uniref:Ribosomal RNA small subunit methyltransferase C n=1 Tax=Litorilituus lipolyticus TaxID=2491017 RepID=A0A502KKU0_9GAMM|nr:methyltransferase [Litorilituus lipolyticus]TPH12202.1 DUF890 domain-containing protein [Litorilituus lipolyticus]